MAPHSSVLAWKIPWTEEPGGLPSMGRTESDTTETTQLSKASLVAQTVKNLPVMQKTQVHFPGQEDPLKKEMATHSSILAWRIPWAEKPDGLQSMGCKQSDMTERLTLSLFI